MPRKHLVRSSIHPYHVTSRSNNKEWFYIPLCDVWKYAQILLFSGQEKFNVKVEAFVLMQNHYHMLLYTPSANIDSFMQFFNGNLGKSIARHAGRINRIFGASYKWNLIISQPYYMNVLRYIYQNPLRADLVKHCEDYPYSNFVQHAFSREKIDWLNDQMSAREMAHTRRRLGRQIININD